ncbi:S1 RNA-binding domain-containing protein [Candidatus Acetothermia bacterium]|jgi:predicted RNA-binding protein with RPS1 domain|nr:S1 RNA-binding domain-containing protein [Candidatus Acetothermia bacterium]MCI2426518.1 S1 RNA-binding domain-containing protein [Candidatus Acetothermia bacterium]MCI2427282.1 S1 RNA-binding domain-containing protein [Candidatus Acetothermia bacterium]MCI2427977.1 S1 RNA-binding domain-containing protein [Candidatus Acetothermia bacterium]
MELGDIIPCKIIALKKYGALAALPEEAIGLIHISEISHEYVRNVGDWLQVGTFTTVKIIGKTADGRFKLSLKQVEERTESSEKLVRQTIASNGNRREVAEDLLELQVQDWIKDVDARLRLLRKNRAYGSPRRLNR